MPVVVGVAVLAITAVIWRCGGSRDEPAGLGSGSGSSGSVTPGSSVRRVDPRTLPRASIAGTIRDDHGAPIANARACATLDSPALPALLTRDPICVAADASGGYRIANLLAASYAVEAMAPHHAPAAYLVNGERGESWFPLAAGEAKAGVDVVLASGAVEVTGTVSDISGGPIAQARVWGHSVDTHDYATETDGQGRFSLWLRPGEARISAVADGYAASDDDTVAPGTIDLQLTPESSLSGTVVDAKTGEPRGGVHVEATTVEMGERHGDEHSDLTDATGHFRITRITPSRYTLVAKDPSGYGRSEGSTLVGLGEQVDGVVIKLHRAYQISGTIRIAGTHEACKDAWVTIGRNLEADIDASSYREGALVVVDGVLPGTYVLRIRCAGHHFVGEPPRVTIRDADVTGLTWEVSPGGKIHGHVRTTAGAPVIASLNARAIGPLEPGASGGLGATSDQTGEFTITGLHPGHFSLFVETDMFATPAPIELAISGHETIEHDVVLDPGGTVHGIVIDGRGKPVPNMRVIAESIDQPATDPRDSITRNDGTFELTGIVAGNHHVYAANRGGQRARRPGTTDHDPQGEQIHVDANQRATVRLVVEPEDGRIRGSVFDADGKPVSDAFVVAARDVNGEADVFGTYWDFGTSSRPVLTQPDGTFVIDKLSASTYTVRAFRNGGGDALARHVAVGSVATLQIKPTASIEGMVKLRTGSSPDRFTVKLIEPTTMLIRTEHMFRTDGRYAVRELPAGDYKVVIDCSIGSSSQRVTLASGEHKTSVDFALDPLVVLTGTLVDAVTRAPIPDVRMVAQPQQGRAASSWFGSEWTPNVTDAAGRFTIESAPVGAIVLIGTPRDPESAWSARIRRTVPIPSGDALELGELAVVRPRVPDREAGQLGVRFKQGADETLDERHEVAWIDPRGPAAKTELRVGDVVTSVNGTDVTGDDTGNFDPLIQAAPGTRMILGLARGATVTIVLGPR
ncbi:MAG: hypothetical protein H6Q90_1371 [Deltaproteobacteria bacterium]|nr:hypothetical protein [Deltaproteobacteria bacterium]